MSDATFSQKIAGQFNALALPRYADLLDYRLAYYDRSVDTARPEYCEHVIMAFWHEYIVVALPRWGNTPVTVLCSQHRDGEWVNQSALAIGMNVVRGSSSRGGSAALRKLRENAKFSSIVVTPDGPRGPRREMALGPVYMASSLGLPLVPVGVGIRNPFRLKTWDRFAIPRPLSRVRVIFGPKLRFPKKLKRDELENCRLGAQQLMDDLTVSAENWADGDYRMEGEQPCVRARRTKRLVFPENETTVPLPELACGQRLGLA